MEPRPPAVEVCGSKLLDHQESHQLSQYHTARSVSARLYPDLSPCVPHLTAMLKLLTPLVSCGFLSVWFLPVALSTLRLSSITTVMPRALSQVSHAAGAQ